MMMDDRIGSIQTPINLDSQSEEPVQMLTGHSAPLIHPTEDSYFQDAPAVARPAGIRDLRDLRVILNNKRRATQHIAIRGVGNAAAWLDQDDSGTYDPNKEGATPPNTPPRTKKRSRTHEDDHPRPRTQTPHIPKGYCSLVTLSFTGEKALEYLRSVTPGPFDSQSTTPDDDLFESPLNQEEDNIFSPHLTRRKTRRAKKPKGLSLREDGLTVDQLTLSHPQRRGCKACFEVGDDDCSLIEHGDVYPCIACDEKGFDCELVVPPELKRPGERCKQKRISCSYQIDGGKGVESCEQCLEAEGKCVPGPLKSVSALRPRVCDSPSLVPPKRQYVSCNQCRDGGKRCSLKRGQAGPCSSCKKNKEDCAFVFVHQSSSDSTASVSVGPPSKSKRSHKKATRGKAKRPSRSPANLDTDHDPTSFHTPGHTHRRLETVLLGEAYYYGYARHKPSTLLNERARYQAQTTKKQQKLAAEAHHRSSSTAYELESPPRLGSSGGIQHVLIKTAFSHPINFNYIVDPLGMSPCSWCSSPFFGLFGHGDVEVEVVPFPSINGHGYEEMAGGHADQGKERSQMCVSCTFARVQLMSCEKHEFAPMEIDAKAQNKRAMEKAVQALFINDHEGDWLAEDTKWCSICPSPAYYRCCARQVEDGILSGPAAPGSGSGCGFLVCRDCHDLVLKISKYSSTSAEVLDRVIRHASTDLFTYEFGVRADASFLTSTGELMVRIQKGMGEKVGTVEGDVDAGEGSGDGEEDNNEIWNILERVGKGKGIWNEKAKRVPAVRNSTSVSSWRHDTREKGETKRDRKGGPAQRPQKRFKSPGDDGVELDGRENKKYKNGKGEVDDGLGWRRHSAR